MMVNPLIWYAERELDFVPRHFVKCPTPVNQQALHYIQNKTVGRYALGSDNSVDFDFTTYVYFEDEREATMYELIWAGSTK